MARSLALILFLVGVWLIVTASAQGSHEVYLPYVPKVPLMQQVIKAQGYTFCLDSRAQNYPNFRAQLADVVSQYEELTGIEGREVAFGEGCQVRHLMPDNLDCGGCAANIYYGNWPVTVNYKWQLGYTDWRTAQGHELGHGLLGLHEQYADSGGQIGCTRRTDTVMDCGSGVRYPTGLDVDRGCAIILTNWCGNPPAPEPPPPYRDCTTYPGWDGTTSCWWPQYDAWLWLITDAQGREQLWEWSTSNPRWRCTRGCPT